jgi:hypothetical protein
MRPSSHLLYPGYSRTEARPGWVGSGHREPKPNMRRPASSGTRRKGTAEGREDGGRV